MTTQTSVTDKPKAATATMKLAHATASSAPPAPGRRTFFKYRDLGVTDASQGRLRAQTMTAITGMTEPTGWEWASGRR